jgi:pimeloyl-ACP methyl ester carboxylesterase
MATALVLVPGLLCAADLFRDQIAAFAHEREVFVADHRAHDGLAQIAASILRAAPRRFALAGLSMGGYLAFEIWRQAPERVERIAFLDTSALADAPEQTMARLERISAAREGRLMEVAAALFPAFVHPRRALDVDLGARFLAMARESGPNAFERQQRAIMARPDSRPTLASVRAPTLVLVGAQDRVTPPEQARVIAEGIAGARLAVIPHCGHLSTMERPEETTRALAQWLSA